ncbi:MAG: tetratricopeptide repeat protein [bacterium]
MALILIATAIVYLPSLQNGFVNWDDPENITENWAYRGLGAAQLRWMFTTFHMGHYQPLAWLTLGADFVVWKMNPFGYHLTSLLFHLASTLVFYFVAGRVLACAASGASDPSKPDAGGAGTRASASHGVALHLSAAFAAGVFALHPMRVESVAWATERRDVVSGLFFLLAILFYLDGVLAPQSRARARGVRLAASLGAFAFALLGKSITATLPAILLVLDAYPLRRFGRRALVEKLPYFALSAAAVAIGLRAQSSTESFPGFGEFGAIDRAAIAAYGIIFYLQKTILPAGLSPAHVMPAEFRVTAAPFVVSAFAAVALTAAALALRARRPALLAIWAAYGIALAPVLGVVQVWRQIVAVRYSYLACLGFALGAGGLLHAWLSARGGERKGARARGAPALTAAAILAVLATMTLRESRAWRDTESLWRHALAADADNYLAHANLAAHYAKTGRTDEADAAFRAALRTHPRYGDALAGLGAMALAAGRTGEAAELLERALASNTTHPAALSNIGVIQMQRGEYGAAIEHFRRAATLDPAFFDAWLNLGVASQAAGDHAAAAAAFREAARLNPEHTGARASLAASLFYSGAWSDALAAARANLERAPSDLASANVAAWILATSDDARLRDGDEAVSIARTALDGAGNAPPVYLLDTYAAALAAAGRFEEAAATAQLAIARATLDGDSAQANESRAHLQRYARGEAINSVAGASPPSAPASR